MALEVKGADLDAQSQQIAPRSAEVQLDIDKLNLQKKLLGEGKAGVQKRAEDTKAQAAQSLQQLIDYARANPGKLSYSTTGIGTQKSFYDRARFDSAWTEQSKTNTVATSS